MRLNALFQSAVVASALALPSSAFALSCDEVMNMVTLNIPANIVVDTIRNAPTMAQSDVQCLSSRGAPAEVVEAASKKAAAANPVATTDRPAPTRDTSSSQEGSASAFDAAETIGDSLTFDDPTEEEEEVVDGEGRPPALEAAIQAYRSNKPASAAQDLFRLLRDGMYPKQQTTIEYYLAKSLFDLEMYHSSQHYFMQVVRKGPANPYFKYALPRLVTIAESVTGNDYELLRVVSKIPPEGYPRQAKNHLFYLMGRKLYTRGELTEAAENFAQVSAKSELYLRAKYYEGIINQQRGKLRSSVMAFREVISTNPEVSRRAGAIQEVEDLKDLAYINVARIYFGLERFDNADTYYSMVDRDSTYWPESLYERAWTNFWKADLNLALGLLLTVESPYFSSQEFIPEVTILRALTFFNYCEYPEVERLLVNFERDMRPMQEEVEAFLNTYKESRDLWDQAYDGYFSKEHNNSVLEKAMFARILRNRDLSSLVGHLDMMNAEIENINARPTQFRDGVGDELKRIIEADRLSYKKRAGAELLRELQRQNNILRDLLVQSEIIRFEVVDAQRTEYEFKAQNIDDLAAGQDRRIDFATSRDIIYWPFNGEFWRDELGYYRYTEHGSCQ
ncbi:MAG: hypothetical protein KTR31_27075 [Myxococcales bacterium]|nr:hypothetical protein [Myxococcales bacterium]